jgi:hypothetical protein
MTTRSERRVLLGLHLPKCAGASLNKVVYRNTRDHSGVSIDDDMFYDGVGWFPASGFLKPKDLTFEDSVARILARPDLRAYVGHFWYGIHRSLAKPWTYFTVLRQPVERILSLHHHMASGTSLDEFVSNPPFREVDNDQTRRVSGDEPDIGCCTSQMLRRAKEHLKNDFSVVGLTERYDETVVLLSRTYGWSIEQVPNQRKNVSRQRLRRDEVPESVLRKILARNELDLELYDYACELFAGAVSRQDATFHEDVSRVAAENTALPIMSYLDGNAV